MTEYARIYLKQQSWIHAKILNVSDISSKHKVTVQITEQLSRQTYSEHCQTFKMEPFAKNKGIKCLIVGV